jgi:hypothetical protein
MSTQTAVRDQDSIMFDRHHDTNRNFHQRLACAQN